MNPHNINHLLTLAAAAENMPSPGVESRLLATIAAQQKRIDALEAITFRMSSVYQNWLLSGRETDLKFNRWLVMIPIELSFYFELAYKYWEELEGKEETE